MNVVHFTHRLVLASLLAASTSVFAQDRTQRGTDAPIDGFERRGPNAISLTFPGLQPPAGATDFKSLVLHDFTFEGTPVAAAKLHLRKLAEGVYEINSLAYDIGEWQFQVRDSSATYYGLGALPHTLNHAHEMIRGTATNKAVVPFFFSATGYGLWVDTATDSLFDMNASSTAEVTISASALRLRVVLFTGPDAPKIFERYSAFLRKPAEVATNATDAKADKEIPQPRGPIEMGGDPTFSTESGLPTLLTAATSGGLSGVDVNFVAPTKDSHPDARYLVRWLELAALSSSVPNLPAELSSSSDETQRISHKYAALSASLAPYREAAVQQMAKTGRPVMRALAFAYSEDKRARETTDEYLFGDDLLVAPVLNEGTQRPVYLPAGDWVNYWTGAQATGGKSIVVDVPADLLPLYVRSGAVLAKQQEAIGTGETRRVYELIQPFSGSAPITFEDSEGRTITRDAGSLKINGKAAKLVVVRWKFGRVRSVTIDGVNTLLQTDSDGVFVEVNHAEGDSLIEWK